MAPHSDRMRESLGRINPVHPVNPVQRAAVFLRALRGDIVSNWLLLVFDVPLAQVVDRAGEAALQPFNTLVRMKVVIVAFDYPREEVLWAAVQIGRRRYRHEYAGQPFVI